MHRLSYFGSIALAAMLLVFVLPGQGFRGLPGAGLHLLGPGAGGPPNTLQVQCNTFLMGSSSILVSANSPRGILIDANYPVELTGQIGGTGAAALLKNNFDSSTFGDLYNNIVHVWNDPSNPPFYYDTFYCVRYGSSSPFYDPLVVQNVSVQSSAGSFFVPVAGSNGNDCPHDGYPSAGIRARSALVSLSPGSVGGTSLEIAAPNPAHDQAIIAYRIAPVDAAQDLALVVRSLLSGAIVREVKLDARRNAVAVPVADLPEGVYVYSLLVNGRPAATHRLMVSR